MQVIDLQRKFVYNSADLADPDPSMTPDEVRLFYAMRQGYAELLNAVVEGPVTNKGVAKYSFVRAAGAKGATPAMPAAQLIRHALSKQADRDPATAALPMEDDELARRVAATINAKASQPLPIPSVAFGQWG
ncbi:PRTRC system protein C [Caenimonas sedimenti]|uniref:PRTRC system protein C n=1 Tax=Caenimonas sedimenti TaxID=2596921 RepID=A0A562ZSC2_9BURK|nr:PRTRC system protein C [Caenimonas sedimenti]TWO71492.1 PRTRC system protein C [Caenimonas sedimenti]